MQYLRRTWAEIDLDAIAYNLEEIRKATPGKRIIAVIKADAYGHGASSIARYYNRLGVNAFAVSNIDEARALRADRVRGDILILGYTPESMAFDLYENQITQAVPDYAYAKALSDFALKAGVRLQVHIKLDTGMGRLGLVVRDEADILPVVDEIQKIHLLKGIRISGVFSHFSSADGDSDEDIAYTHRQFDLFTKTVEACEKRGISMGTRHIANSAGIINYPEYGLDAVRPGIILYGCYPDSRKDSPMRRLLSLRPAMTLKTTVSQVKSLPEDSLISYGREGIAHKNMQTAVVSIGYADGYIRKNAGGGKMTIHGKSAPIVGRICMDMCMLDISDRRDVRPGDEVIIFGQGGCSLEEVADLCETIHYELICLIGKRVPRVYLENGVTQYTHNQFLGE